jgi:hypothetical protein
VSYLVEFWKESWIAILLIAVYCIIDKKIIVDKKIPPNYKTKFRIITFFVGIAGIIITCFLPVLENVSPFFFILAGWRLLYMIKLFRERIKKLRKGMNRRNDA